MGRADLSNAEWKRLWPLLPPTGQRGGRWRDHRQVINGIIWRTRTVRPGGTSPSVMGHGRPATSGLPAGRSTGLGRASSSWCSAMPTPAGSWTGGCRSIPVWSAPTSMPPAPARGLAPAASAAQQGLGRSRGGLSTKIQGGRRWARPAAGDPRHTRPDCGHYRAVGIGGRGQGGPSWWDWPAAGAAQLPGGRQGLQQPGQPGRAARPAHCSYHP
jgi:hypothetical protein